MNNLLDLTAATLSFAFRIITSPLLFVLYALLGLVITFRYIHKAWMNITAFHFKINRSFFPIQLKKTFLFHRG
jgi:hypothetical protein